jgi:uncharacterized protein (TIGR02453 family)
MKRNATKPTAVPGAFTGFPSDMFRFMAELKRNNDRDWFNENKSRYKSSVLAPMSSFIAAMDTKLAKVSDCFVADPRPNGGSMFRIYRDVRFSKDKSPYKEHIACHFRHMAGKDAHAPGFYMHFEEGDVFFGGGIWHPPTPELTRIRERISDEPEQWKRATRSVSFRRRFGEISGESLKRPPKGFDADAPMIDDLKRKSFFAVQHVTPARAKAKTFTKDVQSAFVALVPMMRFLTEAIGVSFSLDD